MIVSVMMVPLEKKCPLTRRQLTFLRPHILKQRKKVQEECEDGEKATECKHSGERVERSSEERKDKQLSPNSDEQQSDRVKEPEAETASDVAKQIEVLQSRLECLKDEKHQLFQQLKTVLHEEDERKRQKEVDQKQQEMEKSGMVSSEMGGMDPRLSQGVAGMKRSLPNSPTGIYPGVGPTSKKQCHRAPLLPTPDHGTYTRQGTMYRRPSVSESYSPPTRQQFVPRGVTTGGQRPALHDQRFGHLHQDIHVPGPHSSQTSSMMSHPQLAPQAHSMVYSQPHPPMPEVPTQYLGMQMAGYQRAPTPSPYSSMTSLQLSSGGHSGQSMQMAYQQIPQPGYVQPHPQELSIQGQPLPHEIHPHFYPQMQPNHHEIHLQNQIPPHEIHIQNQIPPHEVQIQGHPHHHDVQPFILSGQMVPTQGFGEYPHSAASFGHIQDPRHQKLVVEQQRAASSATPIQSPSYSSKHESAATSQSGLGSSPTESPVHLSSRDRRYTSKQ